MYSRASSRDLSVRTVYLDVQLVLAGSRFLRAQHTTLASPSAKSFPGCFRRPSRVPLSVCWHHLRSPFINWRPRPRPGLTQGRTSAPYVCSHPPQGRLAPTSQDKGRWCCCCPSRKTPKIPTTRTWPVSRVSKCWQNDLITQQPNTELPKQSTANKQDCDERANAACMQINHRRSLLPDSILVSPR